MVTPYQKFDEAIQSKYTRTLYNQHLDKFLEHCNNTTDSMIKLDFKEIENIIFDYIIYLKLRAEGVK